MPPVSEKQRRAMWAAAEGHSTLGIPKEVGKEFVGEDSQEPGTSRFITFKEIKEFDPNDQIKKKCAGILFRAPGPLFLLAKRSDNGLWEHPGGHLEEGETPTQAAIRETIEEIGFWPEGKLWLSRINENDEVVYSTFFQDSEMFEPKLNHEHTDYLWVDPQRLPKNTHPEVIKSISLFADTKLETELDLAKAIREEKLTSPQQYENIWLFDVRVTGTGTSYRKALDEYVYRPPEDFLNDDFVERCNGLPLLFDHPTTASILNTEEYRNRAIGVVILPYIKGDEVWGIAKVFDEDAAILMQTTHVSTSPAVVFRDPDSTETIEIDGKTLLIEGKPSLLDHLAICEVGVWDKGGEPSGINNNGEMNMNEEMPAWMDSFNSKLDSLCSRMDSIENKGGDKMPAKADSEESKKEEHERKDSDEKKEHEERKDSEKEKEALEAAEKAGEKEKEEEKKAKEYADSAKADAAMKSQIEALQAEIDSLKKPLSNDQKDQLASAQIKVDSVAQLYGERAPMPLYGENPMDYRKRAAEKYKKYSSRFKDERLDSLSGATFEHIESQIYADAQAAAMEASEATVGRLIPQIRTDAANRPITTYVGDAGAFLEPFKLKGRITKVLRPQGRV